VKKRKKERENDKCVKVLFDLNGSDMNGGDVNIWLYSNILVILIINIIHN